LNTRHTLLILLVLICSPRLFAEWGVGGTAGLLSPPFGFEDPFAYALVYGGYVWGDFSLASFEEEFILRGEVLAGEANSRNIYYSDSLILAPGIALGQPRELLLFEGYRSEAVGFLGYRHYLREVEFNGGTEEFSTPALSAALELWVDSETILSTQVALEYLLTLESKPRHSLNLLLRLGGWW